eukprot:978066-Amorphochlora_amoeboformis.AAC.1
MYSVSIDRFSTYTCKGVGVGWVSITPRGCPAALIWRFRETTWTLAEICFKRIVTVNDGSLDLTNPSSIPVNPRQSPSVPVRRQLVGAISGDVSPPRLPYPLSSPKSTR